MHIALTSKEEQLRRELEEYFAKLLTPEMRAALLPCDEGGHGTPESYKGMVRRIGEDGWLGIGWPEEYGGQGRSTLEQLIFMDEAMAAGVPLPALALTTVGPTIMAHGTEDQKKRFLPPILKGDLHISIGYSEPGAGTDLASLTTRAVRDGDEYVISGQKMWTSLIEYADYVWLAVRTDQDAPKHKGISIFLVPTDSPGFSWTPVETFTQRTSATFYDEVRVPVENLILGENQGWGLITNQLNNERVMIGSAAKAQRLLRDVIAWAKDTETTDGRKVIEAEWVRVNLARAHAGLEFLKLQNWRLCASDGVTAADASVTKVFGSEFPLEVYRLLMEVLGSDSVLDRSAPGVQLRGRLERACQGGLLMTFGGGTNEVQREIIGTVGLGIPRAPR